MTTWTSEGEDPIIEFPVNKTIKAFLEKLRLLRFVDSVRHLDDEEIDLNLTVKEAFAYARKHQYDSL